MDRPSKRARARKCSSSFSPSTSNSNTSGPENEEEKRKEREREHLQTLYRGHWDSLVQVLQIKSKALFPKELSFPRCSSALSKIVPKEGENWKRVADMLWELEKEGPNNTLFKEVMKEVEKKLKKKK